MAGMEVQIFSENLAADCLNHFSPGEVSRQQIHDIFSKKLGFYISSKLSPKKGDNLHEMSKPVF